MPLLNSSENPRIVFMGTPEIAVASLDAILNEGFNVVGVVTAPDKPAGRGKKIKFSAVKEFALQHNLKILQPSNLKDPTFISELKNLEPDIQVVVAFRMLPKVVWELPPKGTFNMHASLLPDLRGAAPINWAIIYGYKKTGVTTFLLNEEIDKGNILFREEVFIDKNETAGSLHDRLMIIGSGLVVNTIHHLNKGDFNAVCQDVYEKEYAKLNPAPKIFREDCKINWNDKCHNIVNFIHGLNPSPGAYADLEINPNLGVAAYKIQNASFDIKEHSEEPGKLFSDGKNVINIAAIDGYVHILTVQEPGKRLLTTPEYLRGVKISINL